jgi:hypothetical protein
MSLVATFVSVRSESILGWAPTIMTVRMKTVALGTALSAPKARTQEKPHGNSEQQRQNAHSEQYRTVHSHCPFQFLGSLTVPSA